MNKPKVVVVKAQGHPRPRPSARRPIGEVRVIRIDSKGAPVIIYR